MTDDPPAVTAVAGLAARYQSPAGRRSAWHGAASVRRQCAEKAESESERQHHLRLAAIYEAREAEQT